MTPTVLNGGPAGPPFSAATSPSPGNPPGPNENWGLDNYETTVLWELKRIRFCLEMFCNIDSSTVTLND